MSTDPTNSDGTKGAPLGQGVQRYVATLVQGLKYRGELASLEWQEEKRRLFQIILGAVLAALSGTIALASINVVVLMLFWKTHRMEVAVGFSVFYLLVAVIVGLAVRRQIRSGVKPFAATFEELRKDQEHFLSRK